MPRNPKDSNPYPTGSGDRRGTDGGRAPTNIGGAKMVGGKLTPVTPRKTRPAPLDIRGTDGGVQRTRGAKLEGGKLTPVTPRKTRPAPLDIRGTEGGVRRTRGARIENGKLVRGYSKGGVVKKAKPRGKKR